MRREQGTRHGGDENGEHGHRRGGSAAWVGLGRGGSSSWALSLPARLGSRRRGHALRESGFLPCRGYPLHLNFFSKNSFTL